MAQRSNEQLAGPRIPGPGPLGSWIARNQLTSSGLGRARKWLVAAGVIALVNGIVAIAVPVIASVAIAVFVGWVLVVAGITLGMHAISQRSLLRGLDAVLALIAECYVLAFPLSGTVTLTFVLAVWLFASGVLSLSYAVQWRGSPEAWMTALGGLVSVILGLLVAASLPSSAAWAIGLLVGVNLILWGVRALLAARLLKNPRQG